MTTRTRLISTLALCTVSWAAPAAYCQRPGLSTAERSSLREAFESSRHRVLATPLGHEALNPGQGWRIEFDGRGFLTTPKEGSWTWGLALESYGFGGEEREVTAPARVRATANRLSYDWDDAISEWYVNDRHGVEHGYTVRVRPRGGDSSPLRLTIAVRGGLVPRIGGDACDVHFFAEDGTATVDYSGLTVFDADGVRLEAAFSREGDHLLLTVHEKEARYPLTIDPIAQQAYMKASNADALDQFGYAVDVDGDTAVIAARQESSGAMGVGGNEADDSVWAAGAVYVFVRSGGTWSQQAYLKASNTESSDYFGEDVAISGDTIVVGALLEDSNATGVNGNQSNNSLPTAGAAYVFVRNGTTWSQQAYLKASNTGLGDGFGRLVEISGNTIAVASIGESSDATGINGAQANDNKPGSGAVYIFSRSGTAWTQQAFLKASNTDKGDFFGSSLAMSGDTLLVGATKEASTASGVNGDQGNNGLPGAGAVYVFVRSGSTWSQQAYLKASNTSTFSFYGVDQFGASVAISGNTAVIGAPNERSKATGVNGDQSDNSSVDAGAAYIFVRNGTTWSQQAYLKAINTTSHQFFGTAVSVSGDTVLVGAPGEDSKATGINGDYTDFSAPDSGAAYLYERIAGMWFYQAYIKASNTDKGDFFASAVALSGDVAVIGANAEDSASVGVNSDGSNNSGPTAGAAYAYDVPAIFTDLDFAKTGANGSPALSGTGTLQANTAGTLDLSNAAGLVPAFLFLGFAQGNLPLLGGTFVPAPVALQVNLMTDAAGETHIPFAWPAGVPAGTQIYLQYLIQDAAAFAGVSFSNGLRMEAQP